MTEHATGPETGSTADGDAGSGTHRGHLAGAAPDATAIPTQVRAAVAILLAEAAALGVGAVLLVVDTALGNARSVGHGLLDACFLVIAALALAFGGRGLGRLRQAARTPVVVLQLLALPTGYSLAFQAGRIAYGAPILVAALLVLYLLFTPPARAVLDRDISR